MKPLNPYESPRVLDSISKAGQGVPEAEVVDEPLVELERRIKSRRVSIAIGTLLAVPLMLVFSGPPAFLLGLIALKPDRESSLVFGLGAAFSGVLMLWSLILGVIGIGSLVDRSGLNKIVRPAHWISVLCEGLAFGALSIVGIANASDSLGSAGVSDTISKQPELIGIPLLMVLVGAIYHVLLSREAKRLGWLCMERDVLLRDRQKFIG